MYTVKTMEYMLQEGLLDWEKVSRIPREDIIHEILKSIILTYGYAMNVDKKVMPDTLEIVSKDEYLITAYACCLKHQPTNRLRKAACMNPSGAFFYARNRDKGPHPDTRKEAYKDPYWKKKYIKLFGE